MLRIVLLILLLCPNPVRAEGVDVNQVLLGAILNPTAFFDSIPVLGHIFGTLGRSDDSIESKLSWGNIQRHCCSDAWWKEQMREDLCRLEKYNYFLRSPHYPPNCGYGCISDIREKFKRHPDYACTPKQMDAFEAAVTRKIKAHHEEALRKLSEKKINEEMKKFGKFYAPPARKMSAGEVEDIERRHFEGYSKPHYEEEPLR